MFLYLFSIMFTTLQFDNDLMGKKAIANHLSSMSVAMNKVVKHLSQLVKVCSQAKASPSVAQGSAARYKDDIDKALMNQLKNGKLVKLYEELVRWEPHPELASYHISPS